MPTPQFEHKPCFLYLCYCFGGPGFESVWPQLFLVNFDILQQTIFLFLTMWSVNIWHSYPLSLCIRPSLVRSLILLVTITQPGSDAGKRTGVFSKCMFWIHDILQRIIKEQVQFGLTVSQQQSDSKRTKYAPEHVAVYYCARHWQ